MGCTHYSSNSFLQYLMVKTYSAVLRLVLENQQPLQFGIPSLVLNEYNARPDVYPAELPTRKRPIGVVITPTKGLANNIVHFSPLFYLLYSRLSRFSNCQNSMSLLSHTAMKPWAKHERLGSDWQMWLRNALDGRWSVWTRSTCATKSGGK